MSTNRPPEKLTTGTTCVRYEPLLTKLVTEFQERFIYFSETTDILNSVVNPFHEKPENICKSTVECGIVDVTFQLEVTDLQGNVELHQRFESCETVCEFWKLVSKQEFSVCWMAASKVAAYFGSSYLCEQSFSVMKTLKSKTLNCLSSEHLWDQIRTCLSSYQLRFDALTISMHCQASH